MYSLGTAPCPQGTGKYIDLARAKSEAPINSNLYFKSYNKLVFLKSVNFGAFLGKGYVILEKNNLETVQAKSELNPAVASPRITRHPGTLSAPRAPNLKR